MITPLRCLTILKELKLSNLAFWVWAIQVKDANKEKGSAYFIHHGDLRGISFGRKLDSHAAYRVNVMRPAVRALDGRHFLRFLWNNQNINHWKVTFVRKHHLHQRSRSSMWPDIWRAQRKIKVKCRKQDTVKQWHPSVHFQRQRVDHIIFIKMSRGLMIQGKEPNWDPGGIVWLWSLINRLSIL